MKAVLRIAAGITILAACTPAGAAETTFSGFADLSYAWDVPARAGGFGLDQAELDVVHQGSANTRVRADLEWVKDGEAFIAQVEQGFVEYGARGATFTMGKFNAPMGFELLDPNEMYQYSHSLVFTFALPTNLTGLMIARPPGAAADARLFVVNGWDRNAETNRSPSVGGRLGFTRGRAAAGVSGITGRESDGAGNEFARSVLDADASYRREGWVLGGELNGGQVDDGGVKSRWYGALLMAHRDFTPRAGFTVRYDWFDDQDGHAFGTVGGEAQLRQAFTFAPTFVLDEGFGGLVELRIDRSDRDAFTDHDGDAGQTAVTAALEFTATW